MIAMFYSKVLFINKNILKLIISKIRIKYLYQRFILHPTKMEKVCQSARSDMKRHLTVGHMTTSSKILIDIV